MWALIVLGYAEQAANAERDFKIEYADDHESHPLPEIVSETGKRNMLREIGGFQAAT